MTAWNFNVLDLVPEVRKNARAGGDTLSNLCINRVLQSQDDDLKATVAAVNKHLELARNFSQSEFPTAAAVEILKTERFRYLGLNRNQKPVILVNFMHGRFAEVAGGTDALIQAYVAFLRKTTAVVKQELGFPHMEPQFLSISIAGIPTSAFMEKLMELRWAHFPAPISRSVFYPVESSSLYGDLVSFFLASCSRRLKGRHPKNDLLATTAEIFRTLNVPDTFIPVEVLQAMQPTLGRGCGIHLQGSSSTKEALEVKNTFIHVSVAKEEMAPQTSRSRLRRHSFCEGCSARPHNDVHDIRSSANVPTRDRGFSEVSPSSRVGLDFIQKCAFASEPSCRRMTDSFMYARDCFRQQRLQSANSMDTVSTSSSLKPSPDGLRLDVQFNGNSMDTVFTSSSAKFSDGLNRTTWQRQISH